MGKALANSPQRQRRIGQQIAGIQAAKQRRRASGDGAHRKTGEVASPSAAVGEQARRRGNPRTCSSAEGDRRSLQHHRLQRGATKPVGISKVISAAHRYRRNRSAQLEVGSSNRCGRHDYTIQAIQGPRHLQRLSFRGGASLAQPLLSQPHQKQSISLRQVTRESRRVTACNFTLEKGAA